MIGHAVPQCRREDGGRLMCGEAILPVDTVEESAHRYLFIVNRFEIVIPRCHFGLSGPEGSIWLGVVGRGVDIPYHDGHVVVDHAAQSTVIECLQVVDGHVAAGLVLSIQGFELGHKLIVDSVPVGFFDIPEHITHADALPEVVELRGIGVVGQSAILPDIGIIVGLLAAAGEKQGDKRQNNDISFHDISILEFIVNTQVYS